MVAENKKKKEKYRQANEQTVSTGQPNDNKKWCDLTNLTKMCNSMTMISKEEHLASAYIEILHHALATFKFLAKFVACASQNLMIAFDTAYKV